MGKTRSLLRTPMSENEKPLTLYTSPLTVAQAEKLRGMLLADGYKFEPSARRMPRSFSAWAAVSGEV